MIDVLRLRAAVLAAVAVADEYRTARNRHPRLVRHAHVVDQPDDGGLGELGFRGMEIMARAVDENGLVGKHEDKGSPRGYDRERLERRVQHERAADHVSLLAVPGKASGGGYRNHARRRDVRHHSSQVTRSSGEGRAFASPYAVSMRNPSHPGDGSGTGGQWCHHPRGAMTSDSMAAVGHNEGL